MSAQKKTQANPSVNIIEEVIPVVSSVPDPNPQIRPGKKLGCGQLIFENWFGGP